MHNTIKLGYSKCKNSKISFNTLSFNTLSEVKKGDHVALFIRDGDLTPLFYLDGLNTLPCGTNLFITQLPDFDSFVLNNISCVIQQAKMLNDMMKVFVFDNKLIDTHFPDMINVIPDWTPYMDKDSVELFLNEGKDPSHFSVSELQYALGILLSSIRGDWSQFSGYEYRLKKAIDLLQILSNKDKCNLEMYSEDIDDILSEIESETCDRDGRFARHLNMYGCSENVSKEGKTVRALMYPDIPLPESSPLLYESVCLTLPQLHEDYDYEDNQSCLYHVHDVNNIAKKLKKEYEVEKVELFVSHCFIEQTDKFIERLEYVDKITTTNSTGLLKVQDTEKLKVIDCIEFFEKSLQADSDLC